MLYLSLMKAKVAQEVDTPAKEQADEVARIVAENGGDLHAAADELGLTGYEETGRLVDNMNVDGGRSTIAMTLEPGQVSEKFLSSNGDGYYFVKLNDKTASEVNYASLKIDFSKFDEMMAELYADDEVEAYIDLDGDEEDV